VSGPHLFPVIQAVRETALPFGIMNFFIPNGSVFSPLGNVRIARQPRGSLLSDDLDDVEAILGRGVM
jgi:hypothetical protein